MKQTKLYIGVGVALALMTGVYLLLPRALKRPNSSNMTTGSKAPCPGETITAEMKDPYMKGIIEPGETFKVITRWYACHPAQKNEIVYYRFSSAQTPVARIVRATEGDTFHLQLDKNHRGWNLLINGETIQYNSEPYFFGAETPPPLFLFEKSRHGIVGPHEAIVLSSWPPGDTDSSLFGLVNSVDFVGKVEKTKTTH
jgi:hypothetical protein